MQAQAAHLRLRGDGPCPSPTRTDWYLHIIHQSAGQYVIEMPVDQCQHCCSDARQVSESTGKMSSLILHSTNLCKPFQVYPNFMLYSAPLDMVLGVLQDTFTLPQIFCENTRTDPSMCIHSWWLSHLTPRRLLSKCNKDKLFTNVLHPCSYGLYLHCNINLTFLLLDDTFTPWLTFVPQFCGHYCVYIHLQKSN